MGKVMILTASQSIENRLLPMISDIIDAELDLEATVLPMDCKPLELRSFVVDSKADVYIVGSSMVNTLSAYVAANTSKPVIGIPVSGDSSDTKNAIFHTEGLPTGMPHKVTDVDDIRLAGSLAIKLTSVAS